MQHNTQLNLKKESKRHIKACHLFLISLNNLNSLIKNMLFINSKITIQIKRNPFSTSLGLLERSANNHCWARTEIHYFQPAVMLMAMIITMVGGLVTCCARKRYHYVTNIILPNPWKLAHKPQRCHSKEIIYEQNQWSVMTFHPCLLKCMEIRWFNTFSLQKGREISSEPKQKVLAQVHLVQFAAFAIHLN